MRNALFLAAICAITPLAGCKTSQRAVPIGCATCVFHMNDVHGCKLAVEIEGRPYLVTGSGIDDYGDAHAPDGLCNTERQAYVDGRVEGHRFVAKHIELLPDGP